MGCDTLRYEPCEDGYACKHPNHNKWRSMDDVLARNARKQHEAYLRREEKRKARAKNDSK